MFRVFQRKTKGNAWKIQLLSHRKEFWARRILVTVGIESKAKMPSWLGGKAENLAVGKRTDEVFHPWVTRMAKARSLELLSGFPCGLQRLQVLGLSWIAFPSPLAGN